MSSQEIFWTNKKGQQKKAYYEGHKNITEFYDFVSICKKDKNALKTYLLEKLNNYYENVIDDDGFLYAKGTCPVLLTAHMDTVHAETVKDFYEKTIYNKERKRTEHKIASPQGIGGDDRCGIYMILNILATTEFRPTILFCEDEEIGGIGSNKFVQHDDFVKEISQLKYFIELDRANANDAVYYDCGNKEFAHYIESFGFVNNWGSFSDICHLSPATDVASVNLSCGYYEAHTIAEYVIVEEMYDTIYKVIKLLEDVENVEQFDYQEDNYYSIWNDYGYGYGSQLSGLEISYIENGQQQYEFYEIQMGDDVMSAFGLFFMDHPTVCWNDVTDYDMV